MKFTLSRLRQSPMQRLLPFLKSSHAESEFARQRKNVGRKSAIFAYVFLTTALATFTAALIFLMPNAYFAIGFNALAAILGIWICAAFVLRIHEAWPNLVAASIVTAGLCLVSIPVVGGEWQNLHIIVAFLYFLSVSMLPGLGFAVSLWMQALLMVSLITVTWLFYPITADAARWISVAAMATFSLGIFSAWLQERSTRWFYLQLMANVTAQEAVSSPPPKIQPKTVELDTNLQNWSSILRELTLELVQIAKTEEMLEHLLKMLDDALDTEASAATTFSRRYVAVNSIYKGLFAKHTVNAEALWHPSLLQILESTRTVDTEFLELGLTLGDHLLRGGYRLDIPIFSRGKLAGAVTLFRMERNFHSHEIKLASSMVFHAMIALRYAKMQQELSRASKPDSAVLTQVEKNSGTLPFELLGRKEFIAQAEADFEKCRKSNQSLSLLLVEIDNFRKISQQVGPSATERLYWAVVKMIMQQIGEPRIIGSYGQSTFAVQWPVDLLVAQQLAETLRRKVENNEFKTEKSSIRVTISIGISTLSEDSINFKTMLHSADMGLFLAKDNQGNTVRVSI